LRGNETLHPTADFKTNLIGDLNDLCCRNSLERLLRLQEHNYNGLTKKEVSREDILVQVK